MRGVCKIWVLSSDSGAKLLSLLGELGGTRTLDPMIKSHVLYHLSYELTHLKRYDRGRDFPASRIMLQPALCRGQGASGQ